MGPGTTTAIHAGLPRFWPTPRETLSKDLTSSAAAMANEGYEVMETRTQCEEVEETRTPPSTAATAASLTRSLVAPDPELSHGGVRGGGLQAFRQAPWLAQHHGRGHRTRCGGRKIVLP